MGKGKEGKWKKEGVCAGDIRELVRKGKSFAVRKGRIRSEDEALTKERKMLKGGQADRWRREGNIITEEESAR